MNDYHAFNSTKGDSFGGGSGCFPWKMIIVLTVIYEILTLIGKYS